MFLPECPDLNVCTYQNCSDSVETLVNVGWSAFLAASYSEPISLKLLFTRSGYAAISYFKETVTLLLLITTTDNLYIE